MSKISTNRHVANSGDFILDTIGQFAPKLGLGNALVYAGELAPEVAERGYFDALVPVEDLLKRG